MKMNNKKCDPFISGNKQEQMWVKTVKVTIWENNNVQFSGMPMYYLNFEKYLSELCKKTNRKINALTRQEKYLSFKKRILTFKHSKSHDITTATWLNFWNRQTKQYIHKLHEFIIRLIMMVNFLFIVDCPL